MADLSGLWVLALVCLWTLITKESPCIFLWFGEGLMVSSFYANLVFYLFGLCLFVWEKIEAAQFNLLNETCHALIQARRDLGRQAAYTPQVPPCTLNQCGCPTRSNTVVFQVFFCPQVIRFVKQRMADVQPQPRIPKIQSLMPTAQGPLRNPRIQASNLVPQQMSTGMSTVQVPRKNARIQADQIAAQPLATIQVPRRSARIQAYKMAAEQMTTVQGPRRSARIQAYKMAAQQMTMVKGPRKISRK